MCWGVNYRGEIGHVPGTNGDLVCTLGGTWACNATPVSLALSGYSEVTSMQYGSCARKGTAVSCWGQGDNGQLGNGGLTAQAVPVAVGGVTSQQVDSGRFASCSLGTDSRVSCWGSNGYGSVGVGNVSIDAGAPACSAPPCYPTPQAIPNFSASKISCGRSMCLAIALDGTVWGWGLNGMGETGHAPNTAGDKLCGTPSVPCGPAPVAAQGLP